MADNTPKISLPVINDCIDSFMSTAFPKSFVASILESRQQAENKAHSDKAAGASFLRSLYAGEPAGEDFISAAYKHRILELLIPSAKVPV
jgi:hypothetical protein